MWQLMKRGMQGFTREGRPMKKLLSLSAQMEAALPKSLFLGLEQLNNHGALKESIYLYRSNIFIRTRVCAKARSSRSGSSGF
jgi:hypothetical protein